MINIIRFVVYGILAAFVISCFTACSSKKLYNCVIDYQRSSADLTPQKVSLPFGDMLYLDHNSKAVNTLLLIHGFEGEKDNWNTFVSALQKEYRIVIPDLPGQGENLPNTALDYTIVHQSKMLHQFVKRLGLKNFHIVGHSMGGAIALQYSFDHPSDVQSLALVDALGVIKTASELENIIRHTGKNPLLHICQPEAFRTFIDLSMNKPPYVPDFMLGYLAQRKCERAATDSKIFMQITSDLDLSPIAKKVSLPTLILWGDKDRILHRDNADLFHNYLKSSSLVRFKELGHAPMMEDPDASANAYEQFLQSLAKVKF